MKEEHKVIFKPRARLIKILGEHLIRDNTVGVLELIKNAYDADAEKVELLIEGTRSPETTQVVIKDNGAGMDSDIIEGRWFEPAHGAKDDSKKRMQKSAKGRIPLGEKGVGRFAVQKLGKELELITRPKGKDYEIVLNINWKDFEDNSKFINEISIPYEKRPVKQFKDEPHGTFIRVKKARENWTKKDLARLQASLIRLRSPGIVDSEFDLTFICPDAPELENLNRSDILDRFQFLIECSVDEKGFVNYSYTERKGSNGKTKIKKSCDLWAEVRDKEKSSGNPMCGPFKIRLFAWLRETQNLKNFGITRDHLQELSGVSIFRDGFRILPYGDPGDDWLQLDQRRINVPASRLGNRQIIGFVELNQQDNSCLIDKTSREGLQENQAFFDMKSLVLGCVSKLEQECMSSRKKITKTQTKKDKMESTIEDLKKEIKDLQETSKKYEEFRQKEEEESKKEITEQKPKEEMVVIPKEKLDDFEDKYTAVCSSLKEYIESEGENREVFLHLVGMGLASERFSHEFERMVFSVSEAAQNLRKKYGPDDDITKIELFTKALKNEVRLMSAMRYIKGSPQEGKTSVMKILNLILMIYQDEIKQANIQIQIEGKGITTRMPDYSVAQILNNIISNAVYWLSTKSQKDDRNLLIFFDEEKNSLLIANNGPTLASNIKSNLFKLPFVTAKTHGRGLGMFISSEMLSLYTGKISVIDSECDKRIDGIGFKVDFPKL
ncbi:ATP-binding protein [Candidatus Woesearchaeota archaeon]|nr:ATP-binding protein [Candidatus Woesearchaeota archaeon]MBW3005998.1 ATP-binding protein [Candidatus Woesearchaeota archaeon]